MKEWISNWGPAIVVMTIIFIASGTPNHEIPKFGFVDFVIRKGGHMLGYALLAIAYSRGLKRHRAALRFQFATAICLAFLYAASDEIHQSFIPGRTPSIWDVCIDTAGAIIGLWLWRLIQARRLKLQEAGTH